VPAVIWNPLIGSSNLALEVFNGNRRVVVDLLDDWSIHYAFQSLRGIIDRSYSEIFDRADAVTANSEGTLALAHRFGRSDCILMPNGVDPGRFSMRSTASGSVTIGYVGKIGNRLDRNLIIRTAQAFPHWRFVFAGPVLDRAYRDLTQVDNIDFLGDVPYERVPELLESFDIGWVPHAVGEGEVGGDVIKIYEYRAAGLPVLSTPIIGAGSRGLDEVHVLPAEQHVPWLQCRLIDKSRVARVPEIFPPSLTWESKARKLLNLATTK